MATDVIVKKMPVVNVEADVNYLPPVDVASLPDLMISEISEIGPMGPLTLAGIPDRYTVAISNLPDLNLRIREIPSIRAHVPANFRLGFSVLGVELAALHLCGEAQVITEPYVPNPCERCGPQRLSSAQLAPMNSQVTAVLRMKSDE
ncbi:hypothetical protein BH23GEM9_BH23GEM9_19630 [soil metagenome]